MLDENVESCDDDLEQRHTFIGVEQLLLELGQVLVPRLNLISKGKLK